MSGGYVSEVIAEALSMAESNACMCRINSGAYGRRLRRAVSGAAACASTRVGSTGWRPLCVASGIGAVIAYRACIAGASGGCQAENRARPPPWRQGRWYFPQGGERQQIGHAVAMALRKPVA